MTRTNGQEEKVEATGGDKAEEIPGHQGIKAQVTKDLGLKVEGHGLMKRKLVW